MLLNQKGVVAQVVLLFFLLIAIGAGLYLSGKTTIFKPRADSGPQVYGGICKFSPEKIELGEKCAPNPFLNDKDPGYKSVTITCADGFKQIVDDGCISNTKGVVNGKTTSSGVDLITAQICRNHSSCPNMNVSIDDPHTQAYPKILSDNVGEYGTIEFNVIAAQGLNTLHTAVWENASSEEQAKKDGRQGRYMGFGTSFAQRQVNTFPTYVEYFAVDEKGNRENVNKRLLTSNPYSITVVKRVTNGDKDYIFDNTPIFLDDSTPSYYLDRSDNLEYRAIFSYLLPGSHKLKYIVPAGYKVSMETCKTGTTCVKNSQQSEIAKITNYQTFDLSLSDTPGSNLELILTYDQPGESKPVITEAKVICDYTSKLNASLYFADETEDVKYYAVRINNTKDGSGWNGSCTNPNTGDSCYDYPVKGKTNIFSTSVNEAEPYEIWYNKVYQDGKLGEASKTIQFTCSSGPETYTVPSPPPVINDRFKATCTGGKIYFTWYGPGDVKIRGAKNPQDFTRPRSGAWWNARNHETLGDIILNIPFSETEPDSGPADLTHYTYDGEGSIKSGDKYDFWIHNVSSDGKTSEAIYISQLVTCE